MLLKDRPGSSSLDHYIQSQPYRKYATDGQSNFGRQEGRARTTKMS